MKLAHHDSAFFLRLQLFVQIFLLISSIDENIGTFGCPIEYNRNASSYQSKDDCEIDRKSLIRGVSVASSTKTRLTRKLGEGQGNLDKLFVRRCQEQPLIDLGVL